MRGVTDRPLVFLGVLTTLDCSLGQIVARLRSIHARENLHPEFWLNRNFPNDFVRNLEVPSWADMHQHLMLGRPDGLFSTGKSIDFAKAGAIAAEAMQKHLLMKGVTTFRDIGGNSLGWLRQYAWVGSLGHAFTPVVLQLVR